MAVMRSGTEGNTPRRRALSVSSLNQRSTRFSQDELVGVKWKWTRGCRSSCRASDFVAGPLIES